MYDGEARSEEEQIVGFADWSLRRFFTEAEKCEWYRNTIFVLLGDHGKIVDGAENEMPESYNHIPLMIYRPGMKGWRYEGWAQQLDVQPTLLGMIGLKSGERNFGLDLLKEKRPYVFYCADDIIGARGEGHLYIYEPKEKREIRYVDGRRVTVSDALFDELKAYLFCNLQAAEVMTGGKD